jgi:hypothetical protein
MQTAEQYGIGFLVFQQVTTNSGLPHTDLWSYSSVGQRSDTDVIELNQGVSSGGSKPAVRLSPSHLAVSLALLSPLTYLKDPCNYIRPWEVSPSQSQLIATLIPLQPLFSFVL